MIHFCFRDGLWSDLLFYCYLLGTTGYRRNRRQFKITKRPSRRQWRSRIKKWGSSNFPVNWKWKFPKTIRYTDLLWIFQVIDEIVAQSSRLEETLKKCCGKNESDESIFFLRSLIECPRGKWCAFGRTFSGIVCCWKWQQISKITKIRLYFVLQGTIKLLKSVSNAHRLKVKVGHCYLSDGGKMKTPITGPADACKHEAKRCGKLSQSQLRTQTFQIIRFLHGHSLPFCHGHPDQMKESR